MQISGRGTEDARICPNSKPVNVMLSSNRQTLYYVGLELVILAQSTNEDALLIFSEIVLADCREGTEAVQTNTEMKLQGGGQTR